MLRDVRVRAREQEAPVGDVRVAGPDLVAVDHVLVALARRGGAQRREVGPGVGLAEALAPAVAPADQAGQEPVLDRVVAVCRDPLDEVPEARARRRAGGRELVVEDHVEDRGQVVAAVAGGPAQPEEAGVVERRVPLGLACPVLVVGRRGRQAGVVAGQPDAQTVPELGLGRRVTKVHRPIPDARAPGDGAVRRRHRTIATRARRGAGRRAPCTPTCCRSRRAPGWPSRRRCGRHARNTPSPPGRRRAPRRDRGRRQPRRHGGRRSSDPSIRHRASASRCCTAWKDPTGTPNCRRSAAYATVRSSTPRMSPTRSALVRARPEGGPGGEVVARQEPRLALPRGARPRRRPIVQTRAGEVGPAARAVDRTAVPHARESVAGAVGLEREDTRVAVTRRSRRRRAASSSRPRRPPQRRRDRA